MTLTSLTYKEVTIINFGELRFIDAQRRSSVKLQFQNATQVGFCLLTSLNQKT